MSRLSTLCAVCAGLALAHSAGAHAQEGPESAQTGDDKPIVEELKRCQAIAEDSARLACFDSSVGAMLAATQAGEVQVVARQELEQTKRGLFGFRIPKLGIFGGDEAEDMKLLQSTITGVRRIRRGYIITIDEGSVWQMNSVPSRLRPPRVGDPVEFKRASLGSYFVRIDGQLGVKGRRIE